LDKLSHHGADQKDSVAFGDGRKDVEMIQFAGIGVAMGNAAEKLKQTADFVTRENYNNGLYYGLDVD
jgi:hydroxymethylpyrimidine pyrophosphatase-like HAD family hydrolase